MNQLPPKTAAGGTWLRRLLEKLPIGAYACDAEGLITYFNPRAVEIWGRTPKLNDAEERFCGSFRLYSTDGTPLLRDQCWMAQAIDSGEEYSGRESVIERPDGSRLTVLSHASPIRDETGKLIGAVNALVDISERKRIDAEREELLLKESEARAEAEAANRSKDEFLAIVSHELRSPLNAILGYNQMARKASPDTPQLKLYCDIIERNARTQLRLIEDLLDSARIVAGKLRLDLRNLDIMPLLADALDIMRLAAETKGVRLRIADSQSSNEKMEKTTPIENKNQDQTAPGDSQTAHRTPHTAIVLGDAARLLQIVWNLLSNAIKFTPAGGSVELRAERAEWHIRIIVSDTGKGIQPAFMPYIFDRFRQRDSSNSQRSGGLGLGLALVKHLAELHGGKVEAASEGAGRGSTFTVTLPLAEQREVSDAEPHELAN
ncbi:MAG TPA: ATP-binding protein [Blastocatellia bacterium]|jgi:signal transduction histidine kinase|nr:ATP-binding protein [Blastocatellia bacterium]